MTGADTASAFTYTFPVYEMAKLRWAALYDRDDSAFTGLNRFWHEERLATHADRWVTTPNVDTLYSRAWLALDQGPVRLDLPATEGRYLSIALLDTFSDNVAIIGPRNLGANGATIVVAGPDSDVAVPDNARVVRVPSNDILVFARVLVGSGDDERSARACQNALALTALGKVAELPPLRRATEPGEDCVALLRDALARNPPRAHEAAMRRKLVTLGLMRDGPGGGFAPAQAFAADFAGHVAALRAAMGAAGPPPGGWTRPHPAAGDFGTFYRMRASVAMGGLLALPQTEAVYMSSAIDAANAPLHGSNRYLLRVPAGGIPADSFWSLTMYEDADSGGRFLVDNPLGRYCLNDRSPGLIVKPDGGIDIILQRTAPVKEQLPNWLPAPTGPFRVTLRAYLPRTSLIDGRFRMPPIEKVGPGGSPS